MKPISIKELNSNTEDYLQLAYFRKEDVIIEHKNRTYKIQPLTPPCQYTLDEMAERIERSMDDAKAGRYYTAEEIKLLFSVQILETAKKQLIERLDSLKLIDMLNIFINELEASDQKPESMFKDKEKFEAVLEKARSFNRR